MLSQDHLHMEDIHIFDRYLILKRDEKLYLYENDNDWNINKPYLSLEPIYDLKFYDCIAL